MLQVVVDDDDDTYDANLPTKWILYNAQTKPLLIITLCTCFELLEKKIRKVAVS